MDEYGRCVCVRIGDVGVESEEKGKNLYFERRCIFSERGLSKFKGFLYLQSPEYKVRETRKKERCWNKVRLSKT